MDDTGEIQVGFGISHWRILERLGWENEQHRSNCCRWKNCSLHKREGRNVGIWGQRRGHICVGIRGQRQGHIYRRNHQGSNRNLRRRPEGHCQIQGQKIREVLMCQRKQWRSRRGKQRCHRCRHMGGPPMRWARRTRIDPTVNDRGHHRWNPPRKIVHTPVIGGQTGRGEAEMLQLRPPMKTWMPPKE